MVSLKQINAAIHEINPAITLYRGESYHYFNYDFDDGFTVVFETESVMTPYTKDYTLKEWADMAADFDRRVMSQGVLT